MGILSSVTDAVGDVVDAGFDQVASASGQIGFGAGEDFFNTVSESSEGVADGALDLLQGDPIGAVEGAGDAIAPWQRQVSSGAGAVGLDPVQEASDSLAEIAEDPIEGTLEQVASGADAVGLDGVQGVVDQAADYGAAITSALEGDVSKAIGQAASEAQRDIQGSGGGPQSSRIPPEEMEAFNRWAQRHPQAARAFKASLSQATGGAGAEAQIFDRWASQFPRAARDFKSTLSQVGTDSDGTSQGRSSKPRPSGRRGRAGLGFDPAKRRERIRLRR